MVIILIFTFYTVLYNCIKLHINLLSDIIEPILPGKMEFLVLISLKSAITYKSKLLVNSVYTNSCIWVLSSQADKDLTSEVRHHMLKRPGDIGDICKM